MQVVVIGEAIVDLVPAGQGRSFTASPGGSPYNVAIGLARLGLSTTLMARLSDGQLGRILREHAAAEGIRLDAAPHARELATLAVVSVDDDARASYDFYADGTADWHWTAGEISRAPEAPAVLHFGSLASWTPPGDERICLLAQRMRDRGDVLVSYDPNVRPGLLRDRDHARQLVERNVRLAHLTRASAEDIGWLYPGESTDKVAQRWLGLGSAVVAITDGGSGAYAFTTHGDTIRRPAPPVAVVDTVGAGDAFTAGLIASLIRRNQHSPAQLRASRAAELSGALDEAILVASLTCQRAGADPPTSRELRAHATAD
jgi:fructokinase